MSNTTFQEKKEEPNPIRYEFKIQHSNNGAEQLWTVSKTVAMRLTELLGEGRTMFTVTRHGVDKKTNYTIEAAE